MTEPDDPIADRLDDEITAALAGTATPRDDPTVLWLAAALRPQIPASVPASVQRSVAAAAARPRRAWWPVRVAAAVLGLLFAGQGLGNLVAGHWVARNSGEPYSEHLFFEGGLVLLAVGALVVAGAVRLRWLAPAVWIAGPLGIAFAAHGAPEVGEFALGATLHIAQGVAALALLIVWWRYRRTRRREEKS